MRQNSREVVERVEIAMITSFRRVPLDHAQRPGKILTTSHQPDSLKQEPNAVPRMHTKRHNGGKHHSRLEETIVARNQELQLPPRGIRDFI